MKRDLLSLADLTAAEIERLLSRGAELKAALKRGETPPLLRGKGLVLLFDKPSLRTRASFEVGMQQLGGFTTCILEQMGGRESVTDLGRVLSRYYDGIVMRTFAHQTLVDLAGAASVPVINGLTDLVHPCQVLAALLTLREHFGRLAGLHIAFVGDGNNVANSWLLGTALMGLRLTVACPPAYQPATAILHQARQIAKATGAVVEIVEDPRQGVQGADAVYTDVWASMGQEHEAAHRRTVFRPYQVNAALMAAAPKHTVVMHCLPAHRGEEITDDMLESPRSLVYEEAENRLHIQKALLVFLLAPEGKKP